MINLDSYAPRGGDIIFFGGADASDLVQIATHVLSNGICVLTHSNLTHCAMVVERVEPPLLVNNQTQTEWNLIECTILDGRNGPQINPADKRLSDYQGIIFLARLKGRTRAMVNWASLWTYLISRVGTDHYSIKTIRDFVARLFPVVGKLPCFHRPELHAEVCSEYLADGFRAGGFPGIDGHEISPQRLAEWAIYDELVQLAGPPAKIRNFNSL